MKNALPAIALVLAAEAAGAQPYELDWWTVDGGGATAGAGGAYAVGATIGQPDAGGPYAGGVYVLHSGFWALAAGGAIGPQADLSITKSNGVAASVPGTATTYTIVAANAGPSAASGTTVSDTPPARLTGVTWTCTAAGGASCPASGAGPIAASVNLPAGGSATFLLTGTIAPGATGSLVNGASITAPAGLTDPSLANNAATDTDTLTPQANLGLTKSDSPDPVAPGAALTYTIAVTNQGPSTSAGMTISDTLPGQVGFVSASAGCVHTAGTVTCTVGALGPSTSASVAIAVAVSPSAAGSLSNTASVTGVTADPVLSNNSDTEPTALLAAPAEGEIVHGTRLVADLASVAGQPDVDLFRMRQEPYSSYEVVLDGASGDIGLADGPALERVDGDGSSVLQTSIAAGTGPARSLRFRNDTGSAVDGQYVRVRSLSCTSDCDADDRYRLRGWETTTSIPRFNNSASQVTVLTLQNRGTEAVSGRVSFWSASGTLLHQEPLGLGARASVTVNLSAIGALAGQGGSITVAHDGPYGAVVGKAIALEPATGFSFDSLLGTRPR